MSSWMVAMSGRSALAFHFPMLALVAHWLSMKTEMCVLVGNSHGGSCLERESASASRRPCHALLEVSPSVTAAESTRGGCDACAGRSRLAKTRAISQDKQSLLFDVLEGGQESGAFGGSLPRAAFGVWCIL
jgi:hypothetical protein